MVIHSVATRENDKSASAHVCCWLATSVLRVLVFPASRRNLPQSTGEQRQRTPLCTGDSLAAV